MTNEQFPWESQITLAAFLGTLASVASLLGYVQLDTEQISAMAAVLFPLIVALRKWSGGEKIVLRKTEGK
jgi:DMSO reductase anchor subunit